MKCPKCNGASYAVTTRTTDHETYRQYRCKACGNVFYTREVIDKEVFGGKPYFKKGEKLMASMNITIQQETRLCTVNGELGYFHCWADYWNPAEMSCRVYGLVEFADRNERVDPIDIKFCDEQKELLNEMAKHMKEESQEPIILSEDEKNILKNIDKSYKWIARSYETLQVFEAKPYKRDCGEAWEYNYIKGRRDVLRPFNHLFAFIKATDEEPYSIEDLLTRGNDND